LPSGKYGVVCYFNDVTEQQMLENTLRKHAEELAATDRRKDEFLAMLAHELRNPLAPMLPGVEVLLSCPDNRHVVDKVGNMLKRQVDQMSHLIDDLLDVSRITTGKIELQKADVELAEILSRAVESVQPLIEKYRHQLVLPEVPDSLIIHADPHRLAQVVSNLLSNAAKYTPPGGRIELSAATIANGRLRIAVKDNGRGIHPAHQSKIFDLFDQGSSGPKDGLGIGLTLVKSLVEMHEGTISLHSEGEGKGSEFSVELSGVRTAQASHNGAPHAVSRMPRAKLRVLIADDGRPTADILAMFFQLEGMETSVAYDGEQAVTAAGDFSPDLVCLDLGMPKVDGYEAARRIRELHRDAYIVALSGWGSEEDRSKTTAAGFNEHLTKPVKPADLRELMSRVFPG
jgi:CheY-like chemotaxis protein